MKSLLLAVCLTLAACSVQFSSGARIVVAYTVCSKSHMFAVMPLVEELAKRGHEVTVFTPFKGIAKNVINGREILLPETAKNLEESERSLDWFAMQKEGASQVFTFFSWIKEMTIKSSEEVFTHPEFLRIVNERDVDLFIADGLSGGHLFPVFDYISVPFVTHCSAAVWPGYLKFVGAPADYASVPSPLTEFDEQMTFTQRVFNAALNEILFAVNTYTIVRPVDEVLQKYFPGAKSMLEAIGDASISLISNHPATSWPRSLAPTVIPIGASHTRPPKPLPKELQEYADEAEEGLIIFSLGSIVQTSSIPKKIVDTFVRVFSKLPQKVIWKWESDDNRPVVPPNVKLVKWLPQQDLLGHKNTKVFIAHGGMLGTQEAAYHGVPILGLPFGNDQRGNLAMAKRAGWAYKLEWDMVSDDTLTDALTYLIHHPYVRANASKVSLLMQDEIMPGTHVAAYWIEHVIRHGGTKHLQLAAKNLPFYKLYFLDAAAVAIIVLILFAIGNFLIWRKVFRMLASQYVYWKCYWKVMKFKKNEKS